jgi:hypothetical protein
MVGFIAERKMQNAIHADEIPNLIEAAKEDPVAFGKLYRHYVQPVYRYLYSQVGSVHDAEELTSQTKPADGPLTIVVEDAIAYYAPLYADPPQATPDETSFTFDAGENPRYGETWQINQDFTIAGYPIHVLSARAANWADIETPNFLNGSQGYEYGYEFTVETDPAVKMLVRMDIMSESPSCWLSNAQSIMPDSSSIRYTELCRNAYPKGDVRVTIAEPSVLMNSTWQTVWQP